MLRHRRETGTGLVPVYVPLSAGEWKEALKEQYDPAIQWFVEQISSRYQVPRKRVLKWLGSSSCPIVLLLDGLDEIPSMEERRKCVRALSQARSLTHAGMIVSCRTNDYGDIGEILEFGGAVDILPLTVAEIRNYLTSAGADLTSLRDAVADDDVLAHLLSTPLMLCVAALAYRDRKVDDAILVGSLADRRNHLWRAYVEEMTTRRRNPQEERAGDPSFPPQPTARYLRYLAGAMDQQGVADFDASYFTSDWLPEPRASTVWRVALLSGLLTAAGLGLAIWRLCASVGLHTTLTALFFGYISAGIGAIALFQIPRVAADWKWRWNQVVRISIISLCWAIVLAASIGLLGGVAGVEIGGIPGIAGGISVGAIAGWRPLDDRAAARRRLSVTGVLLARILTLGVLYLVPATILAQHALGGRAAHPGAGLLADVSSCLGFAAAAVFFCCWVAADHYLSRLIAVGMGLIPLRLGKFLAHSDERILMRRVGPHHYRFVHLTMRDYLAGKTQHGGDAQTGRLTPALGDTRTRRDAPGPGGSAAGRGPGPTTVPLPTAPPDAPGPPAAGAGPAW
jgi:hypothetical protein